MEEIIKYVKSFDGDIFGGYLRDKFANMTLPKDLDCRVDKELVKYLLSVLSINYEITENVPYQRADTMSITLVNRNTCDQPIQLDIMCCSFINWSLYNCDFDVNLLSENNNILQIRPNIAQSLIYIPDKINHIITRAKNGYFALVALPEITFNDVVSVMLRAKSLVERGWIMDDFYLGKHSSLINRWEIIKENPYDIRKKHNDTQITNMINIHDCSLCHERFKNNDIVFNSCCNHNFHWECYPEGTSSSSNSELSGIYHWFKVKQSFTCPYCRQDAIKCLYVLPPPQLVPPPPTPHPTFLPHQILLQPPRVRTRINQAEQGLQHAVLFH